MDSTTKTIIEQIQNQCRADRWFGPPDLKPNRAAWREPYRPNPHTFAFPPASEEQLRQSEKLLGVPIPPLLRTLYLDLANGGFGPGAGLRGTLEGYGKPGTFEAESNETLLKKHTPGYATLLPWSSLPEHWTLVSETPTLEFLLPYDQWPRELLPICDLGCQMEACLHTNGQMYLSWASHYPDLGGFSHLNMTLTHWLESWLASGLPPTSPLQTPTPFPETT